MKKRNEKWRLINIGNLRIGSAILVSGILYNCLGKAVEIVTFLPAQTIRIRKLLQQIKLKTHQETPVQNEEKILKFLRLGTKYNTLYTIIAAN